MQCCHEYTGMSLRDISGRNTGCPSTTLWASPAWPKWVEGARPTSWKEFQLPSVRWISFFNSPPPPMQLYFNFSQNYYSSQYPGSQHNASPEASFSCAPKQRNVWPLEICTSGTHCSGQLPYFIFSFLLLSFLSVLGLFNYGVSIHLLILVTINVLLFLLPPPPSSMGSVSCQHFFCPLWWL